MGDALFALEPFVNLMERKPLHDWCWWQEF